MNKIDNDNNYKTYKNDNTNDHFNTKKNYTTYNDDNNLMYP